ncbi:ArsR/SmtB family transcription factor [Algimonas porphyrae]|nr:metalloregulator ArsR/SmtB family transcription factor [Algimonas porphyrae]
MDTLFRALSDPARRHILMALSEGPATVGQLAAPLDMSFAGASKHVHVLVEARLVEKRKIGRTQVCRLNAAPMRDLRNWLDQYSRFWSDRLDALESAVKDYENDRH